MATIKKYNGSSWENAVVRKFGTATEAVENPLYSDGTAITTYNIKGNEEHTGTPTPSNPVDVNGVGVRTANLFDYETMRGGKTGYYLDASGNEIPNAGYWSITKYIPVDGTTFTLTRTFGGNAPAICLYDSNQNYITGVSYQGEQVVTISSNTNAAYVRFSYFIGEPLEDVAHDMLNTGSTALPFEPYGFKIPISSGGLTTNIYLGSTQTVRQIYKFVLTGNEVYTYESAYSRFGFPARNMKFEGIRLTTLLCTHYEVVDDGRSIENVPNNAIYAGGSVSLPSLYIKTDAYTTETDFKAYLAQQYANGTPVTVWYILVTPETSAVNEPLMKIGDYTDTLSNATAIPTIEGANSITVDTTVQPSEFTATWTGWHDSSGKEWDGSDWQ